MFALFKGENQVVEVGSTTGSPLPPPPTPPPPPPRQGENGSVSRGRRGPRGRTEGGPLLAGGSGAQEMHIRSGMKKRSEEFSKSRGFWEKLPTPGGNSKDTQNVVSKKDQQRYTSAAPAATSGRG